MARKAALTTSGRILSQQERLYGRLCVRCFHASRIRRADEANASLRPTTDNITPSPRRQRAARVSQSIEAIASQEGESKSKRPRRSNVKDDVFAQAPTGIATTFTKFTSESLVSQGAGTATIAGSRFEDVVRDRLRIVTRPGRDTDHYTHQSIGPRRKDHSGSEEPGKEEKDDAEEYGRSLGRQFVAGMYDSQGILGRGIGADTSTMEMVQRGILMNPSYLSGDAQRFSAKVKSLLPLAAKPKATEAQSTKISAPKGATTKKATAKNAA